MVFIPLSDDNPRRLIGIPFISWAIVALCIAVYLVFMSGWMIDRPTLALSYGLIPAVVMERASLPPEFTAVPPVLTLVTSMFLHGDGLHLLGNMLFLLVFADNVEDAMGHWRFALFVLLCAMMSGLAHLLVLPASQAPLIGASGAVSGVLAAYLLLYPRAKLWVLLFARIPLRVTTLWIVLAWVLVQVASGVFGADEAVAWWAHVGGFVTGVALLPLFKRRDVPLFGRAAETI